MLKKQYFRYTKITKKIQNKFQQTEKNHYISAPAKIIQITKLTFNLPKNKISNNNKTK